MHDLAIISKITDLRPIENRDWIEVASVENYDCVVKKGLYNIGDKVIYIFYDSILPTDNPNFEFLRANCYSKKCNGYRIKPMQFGSVISEGLIFPLSILDSSKEYQYHQVITEQLKITPYVEEYDQSSEKIGEYPISIHHSDEENIEKLFNENKKALLAAEYYVTEKIEGSSATWIYEVKDGSFKIYSHNWEVGEKGIWYEVARRCNLKEKMSLFCKANKLPSLVIQGEIIGKKILKNIYNTDLDFYVFGLLDIEGNRFSFEQMVDSCEAMGIKTVPVLETKAKITEDIATLIKGSEGLSAIASVPREGLVYRTSKGDLHFKVKSRAYKIWFKQR